MRQLLSTILVSLALSATAKAAVLVCAADHAKGVSADVLPAALRAAASGAPGGVFHACKKDEVRLR